MQPHKFNPVLHTKKRMRFVLEGVKNIDWKEKMLVTSIFTFSFKVFKTIYD